MGALDRLQFLAGEWISPGSDEPGQPAAGGSLFTYQLDQNVMVRQSWAEYAPAPGQTTGYVHKDMLVIYQQAGEEQLRAIYFDNEGHNLHYSLNFPEDQPGVVFEAEANSSSPRARLVYSSASNGKLIVEFLVASPGGELLSHVKGVLERKFT